MSLVIKTILTYFLLSFIQPIYGQIYNLDWVISYGGKDNESGFSIDTDGQSNLFILGRFSSDSIDVDPSSNQNWIHSELYKGSTFLCKLDSQRRFGWAVTIPDVVAYQVVMDDLGNSYMIGEYSDTVDFDPGVGQHLEVAKSRFDFFILKLDKSGKFQWVKTIGSAGTEKVNSIALDNSGFLYLTGRFSGTCDFNPNAGISNLSATYADIFIMKMDTSGRFYWAKSIGGNAGEEGKQITVSGASLYLTGWFVDTVDFDPGVGQSIKISKNRKWDIFILKLDTSGSFKWVRAIGGNDRDYGWSIISDSSEDLYITGQFESVVDFDPSSNVNTLKECCFGPDIFILKLDSSGSFI